MANSLVGGNQILDLTVDCRMNNHQITQQLFLAIGNKTNQNRIKTQAIFTVEEEEEG